MPLAERLDYEDARFVGLAVNSCEPIAGHLESAQQSAGFDFLAVPLAKSLDSRIDLGDACSRMDFARQDMISLGDERPGFRLLGIISPWIDPDSDDIKLRRASQIALRSEVEWSKYLGLQAVALPAPHSVQRAAGYAQVLNSLLDSCSALGLWIRLCMSIDTGQNAATWRWWDTVRSLCNYHSSLGILIEIQGPHDMTPELMERRWLGEPIRGALVCTTAFLRNKRQFPVLSRPLQNVVLQVFKLGQQVTMLVNGPLATLNPAPDPTPAESALAASSKSVEFAPSNALDVLRAHFEYLAYLFQKLPPLSGLGASGFAYRDHLQTPLQPLADNLDNSVYETFERDRPKYEYYQEAIQQALHDLQFKQESAAIPVAGPIVVAVLGAGRGPLVEASLLAADRVGASVMIMAIEKNPNAVAVLRGRLAEPRWHGRVALVAVDMREMIVERQADIMVSELLGSFGDNELCPECLDGAGGLLRPGGISIPSAYTSFLAPVSAHTVYSAIKHMPAPDRLEVPMVVKLWKHVMLSTPQPVFGFSHPRGDDSADNSRERTVKFALNKDVLPATIHGFAGYFEAELYKNVRISTVPSAHTPDMHSWFPIFFPLAQPLRLDVDASVALSMWRVASASKVWYEWALVEPSASKIHNSGGSAYAIKLFVE
eukprot:jgi/Ulvmu1/10055/UM006_0002.1